VLFLLSVFLAGKVISVAGVVGAVFISSIIIIIIIIMMLFFFARSGRKKRVASLWRSRVSYHIFSEPLFLVHFFPVTSIMGVRYLGVMICLST